MYEYITIITSGKWWLPAKSLQMIWTSGGYQVQAGTLLLLAWLLRHGLWHLWWTRAFHLSLWLIFLLAAFKQFQCQSLESSTPLSEMQKWTALLHPNGPLTVTKVTVICTILGCTSLWWLQQASALSCCMAVRGSEQTSGLFSRLPWKLRVESKLFSAKDVDIL